MPSDSHFDDDLDDVELVTEENELRELESRIEKLKEPKGGNPLFAKGVTLVTSLGFILAGCLAGGYFLGDLVAKRTGHPSFLIAGLLVGLAVALMALVKLMKPFMASSE